MPRSKFVGRSGCGRAAIGPNSVAARPQLRQGVAPQRQVVAREGGVPDIRRLAIHEPSDAQFAPSC